MKACMTQGDRKSVLSMHLQRGLIFFIVGFAVIVYGAKKIGEQHLKNVTYQQVNAVVISTHIAKHGGGGRSKTTYKPVVNIEYRVKNKTYTCGDVFSNPRGGDTQWAQRISAKFKKGDEITAFYNPKNPADAYLIKHYVFTPYLITLGSLIVFLLGTMVMFSPDKRNVLRKVSARRFEFEAPVGISGNRKSLAILCTIYLVVGVPTLAHLFLYAEPPYGEIVYIVIAFYLFITGLSAWGFIGYEQLRRKLHHIRLYTETDFFSIGDEIKILGELVLKKDVLIKKIMCGLFAETAGDVWKSFGGFRKRVTVVNNQRYNAGETVNFSCSIKIPEDQKSSSTREQAEDVNVISYGWKLVLRIEIDNSSAYVEKYPIIINPARKKVD
jgi:hypothetical protein